MKLTQLMEGLKYETKDILDNIDIKGIQYNSNKVLDGYAFVCIQGLGVDRHLYIEDAVKNGATLIIAERDVDTFGAILVKVENARIALSQMSKNFYGKSDERLKIIGVTGTKGKTTTTYLIKSVLKTFGKKVGLIGTIANYIDDEKIDSTSTTPESLELHKLFKRMVEASMEYCIMEVSSHSLALDRVYGINFYASIFTNLTRDHLDFHKTFENYFDAKAKLFSMSKYCIINVDDAYGPKMLERSQGINLTYGINNRADFMAEDVKGNTFLVGNERFECALPGIHNIYNSLATIAAMNLAMVPAKDIKQGLKATVVPGRFEIISDEYDLGYTIVLDYAHNPDSLEKLILAARDHYTGRIITLIGCGGDRDKTKRPIMGEIATSLSDYVYLTSDNPRSEDPMDIISQMESGIKKQNYKIIADRKKAIKEAILNAKPHDVILIAGKGHEDYQVLKTGKIPFDEKSIVKSIIKEGLL
ncbi:MAG: UDP-N-acetylmuramoyl-L-alanyl-D-glutamate--2,6-diaminopimelate ligase [Oscillospiraceae bacterium]|nr:UDP-N-acetylmuramoyl-L-alanyl-D-glutamate--2,6-diaminopimelate ligase [Oscillospiraceae bacterium]